MKTVKKNQDQTQENKSFFEKYKTDKKYKAKVELIGYGVLIGVLIIYLNIASMGNRSSYQNSTNTMSGTSNTVENNVTTTEEENDLLKSIENNYEYDINISLKNALPEEQEQIQTFRYYGKSYLNNMEIMKEQAGNSSTYYKVDSRYYIKETDTYQLALKETIYDMIDREYIELDGLKEYLKIASLDHVTNYSSGKKEYVYHLKVRDVIKSYQEDDSIEMNLVMENGVLTVDVDYAKLMQVIDQSIMECKITYTYKNIGTVEAFQVIESANDSNTQSN